MIIRETMIEIVPKKYIKSTDLVGRKNKILEAILKLNERKQRVSFSHIHRQVMHYPKEFVLKSLKELAKERKIAVMGGFGFNWFVHADYVDRMYKGFCGFTEKELYDDYNLLLAKEQLGEWIWERDHGGETE